MGNIVICSCYVKEMQTILLQKIFETWNNRYNTEMNKRKLSDRLIYGIHLHEVWEELGVSKEANLYYEIYKISGIDGLGEAGEVKA